MNHSEIPTIEDETMSQESVEQGGTSEELQEVYRVAEEGLPEIPDEIEVTSLAEVMHATNMSEEALKQFRVFHSAE